ncbi:MAG TPA: PAS domain-containing protein [Candidatus Baltobacteraceae bacterium]|nr:PAS domain-containing protein [Candidatus Baltobacteraceae bacterium]
METTIDEGIFSMDRAQLDAYPNGVITMDRTGRILRYNLAEARLARRDQAGTIGLNFFRDVAPCTAVKDFMGRFESFARQTDSGVERFDFTFKFAWGHQAVGITLIRKSGVDDINVVVSVKSREG